MRLELKPSKSAIMAVGILHVLTLLLVLLLPLSIQFQLLTVAILMASGYLSWRRHFSASDSRTIAAVEWGADNRWILYDRCGEGQEMQLMDSTVVLPRLIVFQFASPQHPRRSLLVHEDSADPEMLRKFRARLLENSQLG
ncbi:MAG: protein YgfX [Sedimenticola sp.]